MPYNLKSTPGFPGGPVDKNLAASVEDTGSTTGLGRFHIPQSPGATATEASVPGVRAPQQGKPEHQTMESSPRLLKEEKAHV